MDTFFPDGLKLQKDFTWIPFKSDDMYIGIKAAGSHSQPPFTGGQNGYPLLTTTRQKYFKYLSFAF